MKPQIRDDDTLVSALRAETTQLDAPEHVVRRAFEIWQPRAAKASMLGKVLASLKFDSKALSPMALGVRSVSATGRQMIFSAGERDFDVRISPNTSSGATRWEVSGQVLGPDETGTVVLQGGGAEWLSPLNDLSEFQFADLPAGTYELSVSFDDSSVVLPEIEIPGK